MSTEKEELYFYRNFRKSSFEISRQKKHDEKDFIFVRTDAFFNTEEVFFDNEYHPFFSCNDNEVELENGKKLSGFVVEYMFPATSKTFHDYGFGYGKPRMPEIIWYKKKQGETTRILSKTKSGFEKFSDEKQKNLIQEIRENAVYDDKGDSKDFISARLFLDWDKLEFLAEAKFLSRSGFDDAQTRPILHTIRERFNFKTGKAVSEENDYCSSEQPAFSKEVYSAIMEKVHQMREKWAGKKLGLVCTAKDFDAFEWIVRNPYEPNITRVIDLLPQDVSEKIRRENPLSFSEFCSENGIQNTKSLRKDFAQDPVSLVKSYLFVKAGFKDVNILSRMMTAKELAFITECQDSFIYFASEALKTRSEKSVCNILLKEKEFFMQDTINMLFTYREFVGEDLRQELFESGFTEYVHDTLSKISRAQNSKNVKISYEGFEKKYACKIDGYSFHLPKTTWEIRQLGSIFHNCVAGYAGDALGKRCVIAYMKKDESYELCIEIKKNEVKQAFRGYNSLMTEEQQVPFQKWLDKNRLIYRR